MKKFCYISVSLLLSIQLLLVGCGINVMHCARTGTVKIMTMLSAEAMHDMHCNTNACCITMERVELSPSDMAHTIAPDFHVMQPLLAILPSLVAVWHTFIEHKASLHFLCVAWKYPPRAYLNFIRVLQI